VGNDNTVYAYGGGTLIEKIGDPINKYLQEELNTQYQYRCWMAMGPENKWMWIYFVPEGQIYVTRAYGMNMSTGAWTVRDFANKFGTDEGITCVKLLGSETYTIGETYSTALVTDSPFDSAANDADTPGDVTEKYGDTLYDSTLNIIDWSDIDETLDFTQLDFSLGGLTFCFTTPVSDATEIIGGDDTDYSGLVMRVDDGSDSADLPNGTHYYTLTDVCTENDVAGVSCAVHIQPSETTGTACADLSTETPVVATDTTATLYDPSGETYNDNLQTYIAGERLVMGDATGYVYQFDTTVLTDDGAEIDARHITPVIDGGEPDKYKRWPGISIVAEGSASGGMYVRHRTASFDTSDTGWTDQSIDLTTNFIEDDVWINQTSKRIQFEFQELSEMTFKLRSYEVKTPDIQDNR